MEVTPVDTSTLERIRAILRDLFLIEDPAALSDETSLLDEGILDSTGVLELVAELEEQFDIAIDDTEIVPQNLDSVANLFRFVNAKNSN